MADNLWKLFEHIRGNGRLAGCATTRWGRDTYELDHPNGTVKAFIEDEGATIGVHIGDVIVRDTDCQGRKYCVVPGIVEIDAERGEQALQEIADELLA